MYVLYMYIIYFGCLSIFLYVSYDHQNGLTYMTQGKVYGLSKLDNIGQIKMSTLLFFKCANLSGGGGFIKHITVREVLCL